MLKKIKVGVINLGSNNIYSIQNALKLNNYKVNVISEKFNHEIYDAIILPGVGSYNYAMRQIKNLRLIDPLQKLSLNKNKLVFGICLGMQLLFNKSSEFEVTEGLSIVSGDVKKLPMGRNNLIPNVGWHDVKIKKKNIFFNSIKKTSKFYFVHSFYCVPQDTKIILTHTEFNSFNFCSSIISENIFGTQFHPEKSSIQGLQILRNLENFFI